MRGFFAIGVEGISKPMNLGALMRTAHAFGASFVFSIDAEDKLREAYKSDTSKSFAHVPYYPWASVDEMVLPKGCALVGVELTDDAVDLPSFCHPKAAAYVLGRERGDLSAALLARCDHVVKIPTKFCINVSLAGALVMYDRRISLGHTKKRPTLPGSPPT
ncbi:MAG: RNA methyltransferase [Pseudomonadota bacterium]